MFRGILIATTLLMAFPASGFESIPKPYGPAISVPQAQGLMQRHPDLASCAQYRNDYLAAGWPKGNSFDTIRQIDGLMRKRMVFRTDTNGDRWEVLTSDMLAGQRTDGDCEDMAITAAQLAVCAGVPSDRLGLLITDSPKAGADELHMVAFYRDAGDRVWVFGDTFGKPRALSRVKERLLFMASIRNVSAWYSLRQSGDGSIGTSATPRARFNQLFAEE
jgi:predicted transglutaminase-like cysteine proteinase